jgi:hypothetical protein
MLGPADTQAGDDNAHTEVTRLRSWSLQCRTPTRPPTHALAKARQLGRTARCQCQPLRPPGRLKNTSARARRQSGKALREHKLVAALSAATAVQLLDREGADTERARIASGVPTSNGNRATQSTTAPHNQPSQASWKSVSRLERGKAKMDVRHSPAREQRGSASPSTTERQNLILDHLFD